MTESEFKKVNFGYASAEKESTRAPNLLINGFVDFEDASKKALAGDEYLFLGYKGSGKTAIARRLALESESAHDIFVTNLLVGDFPFTSFGKLVKGSPEPESRFPTAWAWLLLLFVYQSLERDAALTHPDLGRWQRSLTALRSAGLLAGDDLSALVKKTSKRGFKVGIPTVVEIEANAERGDNEGDISIYVETLRKILFTATTPNRHVLCLDGFDDIITKREGQFTAIGSLVFEVGKLNDQFALSGLNVKIIVLCRTDLFERITNANKNKARQDFAVELDWYHDPREPRKSRLIEIANTRASLSLKRPISIFTDFFPREIDGTPAATFLLDMTRHTPRDFLQLLSHIQKFAESKQLTGGQIKSGTRDYSIKYFLPELRDELDGYCTPNEIEAFVRAASRLRKREFGFVEIVAEMKEEGVTEENAEKVLEGLFECSGLGNVTTRPSGLQHFTFNFRNRNSVFNKRDRILLHRGMWKALNLI